MIYSSPNCTHWSDVEEALLGIDALFNYILLMGVFNIHWTPKTASQRTMKNVLADCMSSFSPTRLPFTFTHHLLSFNHSIIDYICASDIERVNYFRQGQAENISAQDFLFLELFSRFFQPQVSSLAAFLRI